MEAKTLPSQNEVNIFLDVLRSSGATNMFGARPYVQEHFGVSRYQAGDFVKVWMQTFNDRASKGEVVK